MKKEKAIEGTIELGDLVRDRVTGFTGIAYGVAYWTSTTNIQVRPRELGLDQKPKESTGFDINDLELLKKGVLEQVAPGIEEDPRIYLGILGESEFTGYAGRCVYAVVYLNGCVHVGLQGQERNTLTGGVVEEQDFPIQEVNWKEKPNMSRPAVTGGPRLLPPQRDIRSKRG